MCGRLVEQHDNMSSDSHNVTTLNNSFYGAKQLKNNFQQSAINPNVVYFPHPLKPLV